MKVFIADDSLLVCARLITMLNGFKDLELVGNARSAHEAETLINRLKPDLAILDIQLGNESGIDLLQKSKRDRPSMIAVMLSNHSSPYYRAKCLEAGANFFFDKSTEFFALQDLFGELTQSPAAAPLYDWDNKSLPRFSE